MSNSLKALFHLLGVNLKLTTKKDDRQNSYTGNLSLLRCDMYVACWPRCRIRMHMEVTPHPRRSAALVSGCVGLTSSS